MKEFETVNKLGFYNPRKNIVYQISSSNIDPEIIKTIEDEVLGYGISLDDIHANPGLIKVDKRKKKRAERQARIIESINIGSISLEEWKKDKPFEQQIHPKQS